MPRLRTPASRSVNIKPAMHVIQQGWVELRNYEKAVDKLMAAYASDEGVSEKHLEAKMRELKDKRQEVDGQIEAALRALVEASMKMALRTEVSHGPL